MKNPNLRDVHVAVSISVYEWMQNAIKEGRYLTKAEIVRQALFDLMHRKETTISSYRE